MRILSSVSQIPTLSMFDLGQQITVSQPVRHGDPWLVLQLPQQALEKCFAALPSRSFCNRISRYAILVEPSTPDRVTTDGYDSYSSAIRTTLGAGVRHRDSQYLNNRLEQDHRGVKGRSGQMRGVKCPRSAGEFCRAYDELRNYLRSRARTNQRVSADYRRFHFLRRTATVLSVLEASGRLAGKLGQDADRCLEVPRVMPLLELL